jgi:hypothetical protein
LRRLKEKPSFVTVSGRINNKTKPEKLYESCGFEDKVLWYILKIKFYGIFLWRKTNSPPEYI